MNLPGDDPLDLDAQACFVLSAAARGLVSLYRPFLEPLGITHPQFLVLVALWQGVGAGGRATVTGLADRLLIDPGTLSPALKRLEAVGYVTRVRSPTDARVVEVGLTLRGQELRAEAEGVPGAIAAAAGLSPDDVAQVVAVAGKVVAAVRAAGATGVVSGV
ncbi:MarR family winged helix-turn-helix transcriptional regulator [Oerskovia jenensis]|uniref:MarR family winged helix-turn-helix transcriptional regulator n=1 Tax=Oerskovia jenensis TaxID=162169 RepID=UPI0036DC43FF